MKKAPTQEVQIDSIVGPTHFYGGLAFGNIASLANKTHTSNPKLAALQGLEKMKLVHELGAIQLVLPPHPRPNTEFLRHLGFQGSEQAIIERAYKDNLDLLVRVCSQSAMWMANSATVSPSNDTKDGKVHITPANLAAFMHRALESNYTANLFKRVFHDVRYFVHHQPLCATSDLFDEGAANHTRFVKGAKFMHFFVYGKSHHDKVHPKKYPARQTRLAQEAVCRRHLLDLKNVIFAQQNPAVIDKGVFHNDVIAVGHEDLLIVHEEAYMNMKEVICTLTSRFPLNVQTIRAKKLSVQEAVKSYLFNSQILRTLSKERVIICPSEVLKIPHAKKVVESLPFDRIYYLPLNQSMKNGGGPACLRLRLDLTAQEVASVHSGVFFSKELYDELKELISLLYPESLKLQDLLKPDFRRRCQEIEQLIHNLLDLKV